MFALPGLFARFKGANQQAPQQPEPLISEPAAETLSDPASALVAAEGHIARNVVADPELDAAIAKWREAVALTPNFLRAHLRLGLALYQKGLDNEAIPSLSKTVRLGMEGGLSSTDNAIAQCALGCALMAQGTAREAAAVEAFQQAMRLLNTTPDFAPDSLTRGLALFEQGLCDQAIPALRETTTLGPDEGLFGTDAALAHCALGCALLAQSQVNRDLAVQEFQETFRLLRQFVY